MKWYKHDADFRNTPTMKSIRRRLGDRGCAAAYRLLEVMTGHCGSGESFKPELALSQSRSMYWLAEELGITVENEYTETETVSPSKCLEVLEVFANEGFINLKKEPAFSQNPETSKFDVPIPNSCIYVIEMPQFASMRDEYTERNGQKTRKRINVLSTPK